MSIQSMTSRDTVTIKRVAVTQGSEGGSISTYTTDSRGTLPTSLRCRFQPLSTRERVDYGIRGDLAAFKFLFHSDPEVDVRDQFVITDGNGVEHTCRITGPSRDLDNQGRLFVAIGEEMSNRT